MDKKTFFKLVKEEAERAKATATKQEKSYLDYDRLGVQSYLSCLRGQMTGHADSVRADEILPRWMSANFPTRIMDTNKNQGSVFFHELRFGEQHHTLRWNPLELYVTLQNAKNRELVGYLKGERRSFEPDWEKRSLWDRLKGMFGKPVKNT